MPLREYQTDMMQMPLVRQFITDDEVNADLTRGSGFSGGKARIYNYWQENHSAKEKMDFLKHEYTLIALVIVIALSIALELFLSEYLLYHYDHDEPFDESEE